MKKFIVLICCLLCFGCTQHISELNLNDNGCFNSIISVNKQSEIIITNPIDSFFSHICIMKSTTFFSEEMLHKIRKGEYQEGIELTFCVENGKIVRIIND